VGTGSAAQTVMLTNTGTAALTISGIAITGSNSTDFEQSNNCGSSLAPAAFCAINVVFSPTALGTRAALLSIVDNAVGSPQAVALSGVAIASTVPAINAGGVTIGAGFQPGFAPGSLISIFGTNFAAAPTSASGSPLPTTLGGVQVLVNNQAAPLFFVNGTQINVQAPFELVAGTPATITVIANGSASAPVTVSVTAEQPGIFILGSFGNQGTILLAGTGTLAMPVTPGIPSAPAQGGDYLSIFCTGLGATTPFVPTNTVSPGSPPATVNNAVTATIGGLPAMVSFAGLAPGFIGLYQVNVQVPPGVAGNAVAVFLTQGGVPSNVATIAVQ
jgi:uncharacterized protein (TIGR03437 family)